MKNDFINKILSNNKNKIKLFIKILGYLITILSFIFIFYKLKSFNYQRFLNINIIHISVFIIICTIINIFLIFLSSIIWKKYLEYLGNVKINKLISFKIFSISNIAKYIPGNIMQFLSRNMLHDRLQLSHKVIAFGTIFEIFFDLLTALIISLFFIILNFKEFFYKICKLINFTYIIIIIISIILITITLIIFLILRNKDLIFDFIRKLFNINFVKLALTAIIINSIVFIIYGILLIIIFKYLLALTVINCFYIICAFVISWFLGYITPGASGGLGVRESVLIVLLSSLFNSDYILEGVLIHRIISIIADILAFILSLFIKYKKYELKTDN